MQSLDCIKSRRSIRLFLNKKIKDDIIIKILEAAINAPSSRDCQPWHFVLINDEKIKQKLANMKTEGNQQHILTSSVTIIVCIDTDKSPSKFIEDGVCASQNILLAANDLGLGSVYISSYNEKQPELTKQIQSLLNLKNNYLPITILPIGYPDPNEKIENKTLIKLKNIVQYNKA